jgi:hypothetical protein
MLVSETVSRLSWKCLMFLPCMLVMLEMPTLQAQTPKPGQPTEERDVTDPNNVNPTPRNSSLLSLKAGQDLMKDAKQAIDSQNYAVATKKLQDARVVFNQLSNFYQQLASSFAGIDNRLVDGHRRKVIDTANLRDEATYQLALVHRAQNQPELAVPLLIQVIRSQNPTRDLGKKSYQQLYELGFVDSPYGKSAPPASSSAPNPQPR